MKVHRIGFFEGASIVESQGIEPAPRVGLAWDIFGDGSTALHTSAGLYFNSVITARSMDSAANNPPAVNTPTIIYGTMDSLLQGAAWTIDTRAPYVLSLAYLALFGSVVAFGAYLTLLKQVGPGPASYVGVATPIIAMAVSTMFEGYRWTHVGAFGVVLAIAGNWLALKPARLRLPASASVRNGRIPL